jgi:glucosyl-dolichyl phosphate glucuronosyltransferase
MRLLIAICTYNRAEMLRGTLESLCDAEPPIAASWSVLVMNNRSSDHTEQVISDFEGKLPIFRGYQPIQGLSNARNAVIESELAESADYIIWTDDDVRVEPQWLRAYESAFLHFPHACLFGGNVVPLFEGEPPKWLLDGWDTFKEAYPVRQFDVSFPLEAKGSRIPYGANFAIRAMEQRKLRYDPKLGIMGNTCRLGEETAVIRQLLREGHTGWWVPEANVRHFIPRQRMSMASLGRFFRGVGATEAIKKGEENLPWYRKPRWLWRAVPQQWGAYLLVRAMGDTARWPRRYRAANFYTGWLFS